MIKTKILVQHLRMGLRVFSSILNTWVSSKEENSGKKLPRQVGKWREVSFNILLEQILFKPNLFPSRHFFHDAFFLKPQLVASAFPD